MASRRRFDETDFSTRQRAGAVAWPLPLSALTDIGQTVMKDRNGKGRPHHGVDLFAPAGTAVLAAQSGRVLRVEDGRRSSSESRQRAGLWIDIRGQNGRVFRYLHLGTAEVRAEQTVTQGQRIGSIATAGTSGLSGEPRATHLHFEIRQSDWSPSARKYGSPIDPLTLLPGREA